MENNQGQKKILIFSTAYLPLIGGAEIAVKEITDRLPWRFDLITARLDEKLPCFEKIGNINIHRVGFGFGLDKFLLPVLGLWKAEELEEENGYDLIWSIMASQAGVAASFFKILHSSKKMILTLQEGDLETHLERYALGSKFLYHLLIKPWHLLPFRKADAIQAISQDLKNRTLLNGVKASVTVVPNGADAEIFRRSSEREIRDLKDRLEIRSDEKVIFTASRLVYKNGVDNLIEAGRHLNFPFKVLIAGGGKDEKKLKKLTEQLGLADRVVFLGQVDHNELPKYYSLADVFVRASRSEGFGNVFIESLMCGTPIVGTNVGGSVVRELEEEGMCFVLKENAPEEIAEKIKSAVFSGRTIPVKMEKYTWRAISAQMGKIFGGLAADDGRRRIVIATGTFLPEISGQSTFVSGFVKKLPESIRPIVVSYGRGEKQENVFFVEKNAWRHFNYWRLLREIKGTDIIYAQDLISSGLPAALAKGRNNRLFVRLGGDFLWEKMVNTGRCQVPFSRYYEQPKSFTEKMYLAVYRFVLNRCDKVIFNTRWQADIYQKVFALPAGRIAVVENQFSDLEFSDGSSGEIVFAGRFIPLKNLKRLIEAFKEVKTDRKLVLIGGGPQKKELVSLAEGDRRIKIESGVSRKKLLKRISRCEMLVVPSLSEMSPNVVWEALSLKKKVLLTQENGLPEEIKKYCQPVDPLSVESIRAGIEKLLSRQIDFSEIPSRGWRDIVEDTLKLFYELNIVNIGTDKTLVGGPKLGDAIERHREYGKFVGHLDIIVYTNKKEGLKEFKISDNVIGHPSNSFAKAFFYCRAKDIFREINRDHRTGIIVAQDPFLPALIGWRLKKKYGCKLQVNFHGDFWQNAGWLKERWLNIIFLLISRFTVPRADVIRVMSRGQKEKLVKAGIGWDKIKVISTPVEVKRFRDYDNRTLIDRLRQKMEGRKMVLMVGRKDKVKDFDTLFRTMNLVYQKNGNVGLCLVGNYSETGGLPLPKGMRVMVNSEVDTNDLPAYYHACYLVVSSSASESFGKVLVEANACGKPVVATATTGSKEIVANGRNGFLTPIGDAGALAEKILYLLNNPAEAEKMGKAGREMAEEKFNQKQNIEKIINLWKETNI